MSDNNELPPEAIASLQQVSALEAWCLAAAIASLISAGDKATGDLISEMANDMYTRITSADNK